MLITEQDRIAEFYKKVLVTEAPKKEAEVKPTEDSDKIEQQPQSKVDALNQNSDDILDLEDIADSSGDIEQYEDTDLPRYNYKSLYLYINLAYQSKQPLLVYGDPGMGKSEIVRNFIYQVAESKGREPVYWNKASREKQLDMIANPGKYFTLVDQRAAALEPVDFIGIPDISSSKEYLETKQLKWIYYMSQPEADGILFLDELNQGSEQTLKALFEVVLDKTVGGTPFSENIAIMAAGNLGAEFGNQPIPRALTNRFKAGVLVADPETWMEYAENAGIDKRILAFVRTDPGENFYRKPTGPDDPFPTPRQLMRLSREMRNIRQMYTTAIKEGKPIKDVPIYKAIGDEAAGLCGIYWARKFLTFLKHIKAFDFKKIITDVKNLNKENKDKLHALVVFVVNKLKVATNNMIKSGGQASPNDVEILEGIAKITNNLNKEWSLILWNQIKRELPIDNFKTALDFLATEDYDAATKKEFIETTMPGITKLLKGS
jgi:MoxR-like ATPase